MEIILSEILPGNRAYIMYIIPFWVNLELTAFQADEITYVGENQHSFVK
jgi:hypothetical protein